MPSRGATIRICSCRASRTSTLASSASAFALSARSFSSADRVDSIPALLVAPTRERSARYALTSAFAARERRLGPAEIRLRGLLGQLRELEVALGRETLAVQTLLPCEIQLRRAQRGLRRIDSPRGGGGVVPPDLAPELGDRDSRAARRLQRGDPRLGERDRDSRRVDLGLRGVPLATKAGQDLRVVVGELRDRVALRDAVAPPARTSARPDRRWALPRTAAARAARRR